MPMPESITSVRSIESFIKETLVSINPVKVNFRAFPIRLNSIYLYLF